MKSKRIDVVVMIIFPIFAAILTIVFKTNFLISTLLFFGLPSLYIAVRNSGILRKSLIFGLLLGTIFYVVLDPLAAVNGAWLITSTIFSFKFLGVVTIENYIFALLWVFLAILFYEHFFDRGREGDTIAPSIRYLIYPFAVLITFIIALFYLKQGWLHIPYFYLVAGTIFAIIPLGLFLYNFPTFLRRFVVVGLYFAILLLLFEVVALRNGQWIFPSTSFLGFVSVFGYKFPIEELFVWIIAATPGLLSYYEFFADDRKLSH